MLSILLIPLFALLYRVRGMEHSWLGTTATRLLFWALPCGLASAYYCHVVGAPLSAGLICFSGAYFGIALGHGFAQGEGFMLYAEQGLIGFVRTGLITLPLLLVHPAIYVAALPLFMFPATTFACYLSYLPAVQKRSLFTLCVPGDSSWEELFVGAVYGAMFAVLVGA